MKTSALSANSHKPRERFRAFYRAVQKSTSITAAPRRGEAISPLSVCVQAGSSLTLPFLGERRSINKIWSQVLKHFTCNYLSGGNWLFMNWPQKSTSCLIPQDRPFSFWKSLLRLMCSESSMHSAVEQSGFNCRVYKFPTQGTMQNTQCKKTLMTQV